MKPCGFCNYSASVRHSEPSADLPPFLCCLFMAIALSSFFGPRRPLPVVRMLCACVLGLVSRAACANPIDLDALVGIVVARNPAVLAAAAEARGANEDLSAARWQRFPTFSVQAESQSLHSRDPKASAGTTTALTQPLWMISGSIPAQIEGAQAGATARQARVSEVRYLAAERTVDAWWGGVTATAKMEIASRALARLTEFRSMMRRRVDASVSPVSELDLVSSRVSQAQSDLASAQASQRLFLSRLEELAGEPVGPAALVQAAASLEGSTLQAASALADLSDAQFAEWVDRHPAVRRANSEAQVVKAQAKAKDAERWPQLYVKLQHTTAIDGSRGDSGAFLGLQYTPGAGLSSMDQARAARARAEGATVAIEQQRREELGAFQADWSELRSSREKEEMLLPAIGAARAVLASYERLFIAGRRSWLDVLSAVRELQQNEDALATARTSAVNLVARIQLRAGQQAWQREGAL
ncbi:TolC family protein [Variovorax humicola]|uniref:TolC family protein n=1 Tax=Variovorax humicola TaxID=1769758 RepID=A0ABU8VXH8_9BURK